ncbi:MAG: calcium-binding protein [Myxococcaceae bacterium]|nr:calcium-binding protein [Myxococcaceae bacterium]MCA3013934.1 calcium-binding protein [Myxococcaceae bacterium]
MTSLRRALLTLSLSTLPLSGAACQGSMSDEEALVGEATSSLTVGEETGDLGAEAAAGQSDSALEALATDASELPGVPDDAPGVCDVEGRRRRVLARYDENGDGQLGPAERAQLSRDLSARGAPLAARLALRHRAAVMERVRWAFDENADGALSADERTALVDALEARCLRRRAAVVAAFDGDRDGALDVTERQAAKAALQAKVQALRQQVLAKHDANGNGALDDAEKVALRRELVAAWKATRAEVVKRFDANGDGALDDGERLALKRALQQRIAEGRDAE